MAEPLRPLSIGELLDRTLSLYRQNFRLFVGVSILGPAVGLVFNLSFAGSTSLNRTMVTSPFSAPGALAIVLLGLAVMMFGYALAHAAAVKAVAAVYLGRSIGVLEAYRAIKKRFWRIIGVTISVAIRVYGSLFLLVFVAAIMAALLTVAVGIFLGTVGRAPEDVMMRQIVITTVMVVFMLVALGLGAVFVARYALAIQACVVEDLPRKQSLKRSVLLSKGSRGRIVTIYGVFVILGLAVSIGLTAVFRTVPNILIPGLTFRLVLNQIASLIAGTLIAPLAVIAMSLVYYDERVRKEAFDLQLMMESLDSAPSPVPVQSLPGTQPG
jgi:hypothetical protein